MTPFAASFMNGRFVAHSFHTGIEWESAFGSIRPSGGPPNRVPSVRLYPLAPTPFELFKPPPKLVDVGAQVTMRSQDFAE